MQIPSTARTFLGAAAALTGLTGALFAGGGSGAGEHPSPFALEPAVGAPAAPPAAPSPDDLRVYWRGGLRMETADKEFSMRIFGRIHNDWVWHSADDEVEQSAGAPFADGTRFRRARLGASGTMYDHMFYKAEYDFGGGTPGFRDVFMGTSHFGFADVRVGHFKEFFGLEQLTSSNNITFVERSLPHVFTPSRNTGLGLNSDFGDARGTWGVGIFRDTGDFGQDLNGSDDDGGYALTGRLTYLPLYQDGGERLLHLGASATYRDQRDDTLRYRQRPENSFAPRLVDTGTFDAKDQTVFGLEAAWVQGPLSIQGEYMLADVSSAGSDDPTFTGYYAMISYLLTGERRGYSTGTGNFSGVRPSKNFGPDGMGAWELAARYSALDLEDGAIAGGELENITAGVNWYWNPNARIMLNYVHSDVSGGTADGNADAVLLRFQVAF